MKVDFGTYHHSTYSDSEKLREKVRGLLSNLLPTLFPADTSIRVLDAGCGLGFLCSVVAELFPNARIVGVDTFSNESLSGSSIEKADNNMKILGVDSRVSFHKHDLTEHFDEENDYDLIVSNLVFHNLGDRRFEAYENVLNALHGDGFFVIGDLFPSNEKDTKFLCKLSDMIEEIDEESPQGDGWRYRIKILKKLKDLEL